ncbi:hypothetical protein MRX96_020604 [Rhipicephalus microplus]
MRAGHVFNSCRCHLCSPRCLFRLPQREFRLCQQLPTNTRVAQPANIAVPQPPVQGVTVITLKIHLPTLLQADPLRRTLHDSAISLHTGANRSPRNFTASSYFQVLYLRRHAACSKQVHCLRARRRDKNPLSLLSVRNVVHFEICFQAAQPVSLLIKIRLRCVRSHGRSATNGLNASSSLKRTVQIRACTVNSVY